MRNANGDRRIQTPRLIRERGYLIDLSYQALLLLVLLALLAHER